MMKCYISTSLDSNQSREEILDHINQGGSDELCILFSTKQVKRMLEAGSDDVNNNNNDYHLDNSIGLSYVDKNGESIAVQKVFYDALQASEKNSKKAEQVARNLLQKRELESNGLKALIGSLQEAADKKSCLQQLQIVEKQTEIESQQTEIQNLRAIIDRQQCEILKLQHQQSKSEKEICNLKSTLSRVSRSHNNILVESKRFLEVITSYTEDARTDEDCS